MIKIVKTVCLLTVLTTTAQTELVAMNCPAPSDLDIIFSLEYYAKNCALFDIINNNSWNESKKLIAITKLFKQVKPNTNAKDSGGFTLNEAIKIAYTPLQWAILKGEKLIIKLLIKSGANIDEKASDGSTALHIASAKGYKGIIRILLNKNISINGADYDGNTALHIAAFNANKNILQLLIKRGIDYTTKNKGGFTAEDILAFGCKNPDLFKEFGISKEQLVKCHAYLKLVTDFFTALKTMQESTSMFDFFDFDKAHKTKTFEKFAEKHLIGENAKQNSEAIKDFLYLDKQKDFAMRFTNWYKQQYTNPKQTPAV